MGVPRNLFIRFAPAELILSDLAKVISFLGRHHRSNRYAGVDFDNWLFLLNVGLKFW